MYTIEKRSSGLVLTFGGRVDQAEMQKWLQESKQQLVGVRPPFGVIVDMRKLAPLAPDAQTAMLAGQKLYKEAGMQRSAVALDNAITTAQFRRLAKESGIDAFERYLDASSESDWQQKAVNWVKFGIDPYKAGR
jgi:hypothetical protein